MSRNESFWAIPRVTHEAIWNGIRGENDLDVSLVMISLALFLTGFVMAPTLQASYREGLQPLMADKISETEAIRQIEQNLAKSPRRNPKPGVAADAKAA